MKVPGILSLQDDTEDLLLETICAGVPDHADEVQISSFIIAQNSHGTVWGALHQLALESRARMQARKGLQASYLRKQWSVEDTQRKLESWTSVFRSRKALRELRLRYEEGILELDQIRRSLEALSAELSVFKSIAKELKCRIGEKLYNEESRKEMIRDYWTAKLSQQLNVSVALGCPDAGTFNAIASLDPEMLRSIGSKLRPGTLEFMRRLFQETNNEEKKWLLNS